MERADYWTTVSRQATSLQRSIDAVSAALRDAPPPRWEPGQHLAVIAMGASTMAAEWLVHEARCRNRSVINWPAAEWGAVPAPMVALALGISESGRSPETIDALERCGGHRIVITNDRGSAITQHADAVAWLGGISDSGVYVSGYTSTLAALALVGEAVGLDGLADGLERAPALIDDVLGGVEAAVDEFLEVNFPDSYPAMLECVGAGRSYAAAAETALLLREAGRTSSATFQTDQYLHGPAESLPADVAAVVFGAGRERVLNQRLAALGIPVLRVSAEVEGAVGAVRLPAASSVVTSILEALVGQVLAGRLGDRRGHELGTFRQEFEGTKLSLDPRQS